MLRSEEVNKFILYIPTNSSSQIIEILGNHKLIHVYPTGSNDHFSKEQRELEKKRTKLKFILTEAEKCNLKDSMSYDFDLDDIYNRLSHLKQIQSSTAKNIQRISEDLFILKEVNSSNEHFLIGSIDNEKSFLFEKVVYEMIKRNIIFTSQNIPFNQMLQDKTHSFTLPPMNKKSYFMLLHSEETFVKISKIFESLGGRILSKEKIASKHKNILHCSTLLAQLKQIYINNEINIINLLSKNINGLKSGNQKNEKELKIHSFLSGCYFSNNSFIALTYIPKRHLYKFRKVVEYVNQEYSLAVEEYGTGLPLLKSEALLHKETKEPSEKEVKETVSLQNKEAFLPQELSIKEETVYTSGTMKQPINESNESINQLHLSLHESNKFNEINQSMTEAEVNNLNKVINDATPPSYFHTGKYTKIYQELTNTFEVPKYMEINPGVFTLFFFPFLFGIMFSDVLHGLILLSVGLALVYSKRINKLFMEYELLSIIENAKYLLIGMGVFSIYFGLLFCDFGGTELHYKYNKIVYFGVNEMKDKKEFINKLKMKMSIIVGAVHMFCGIILSYVNKSDNLISLISSTVAYLSFVGYLVFLIFYKWVVNGVEASLINEMVEMYTKPFANKSLYPFQKEIQLVLITLLLCSMAVLFLNKPIFNLKNMDLWVEQSIHTIEFGVSLISNTASYLRLWAVSLAHGTLTEILHANTFGRSIIIGILCFPLYIAMTLGLLIGLEGTSATLHALRLNWIEFSGKFMMGGGIEYKPFSFEE